MIQSFHSIQIYSNHEIESFLNALEKSPDSSRYENPIRFFLQTGLRYSELACLVWNDVDFENKVLRITKTLKYDSINKIWFISPLVNTSRCRLVPLSQEAIKILKNQELKNDSLRIIPSEYRDIVFLTKNGHPISLQAYNRTLSKICSLANLPPITVHMLRPIYLISSMQSKEENQHITTLSTVFTI